MAGQKPYDGSETFETSGCTSRPRFEKYNEMRKENKKNSRLVQLLMGGFWRL